MASALQNLSGYDPASVPNGKDWTIGVVVSEWNSDVTGALLQGAYDTLIKHGVEAENIIVKTVPGSFELIFGAATMVDDPVFDAVIVLGCVIQGDTPHFDYICQGTTQGIAALNARAEIPVIYGLLTCLNMQQALDRCGGACGNKGVECAVTALKMIDYRETL